VGYTLAGVVIFLIKTHKVKKENRGNFLYITIGVIFMFLSITVTNFILPILFSNPSYIPLAILSFFPFIILTSYAIAKNHIFSVKIIGAEIFMIILLLLTLFQLMQASDLSTILTRGGIFISLLGVGVLLIKSVMKEVKQRERLEILTGELEVANKNLKDLIKQRESLVYLITHKVKGAFTHTKSIFAEILEGSFGPISPELKKMAEFGLESDETGVTTVDLILNASNLQKGTVKYDMKPVDIKEIIAKKVEEKRDQTDKKGLKMETDITNEECIVNGDGFWLKEVVNNLLDNSIKYTKEGKIVIGLKKENNKILFSIKDTGVGITDEDKKNLFTEGGRGKNSVKVNVDSTGYGLYTVKLIIAAHNGRAWVESEGEGKGSQFFVELNAT
jgi:signal transduction histidine kinase